MSTRSGDIVHNLVKEGIATYSCNRGYDSRSKRCHGARADATEITCLL